jgi:ribonuclease HI
MMFRDGKVYAETGGDGAVLVSGGKVKIKYREDDDKFYLAKAENVQELDERKLAEIRERKEAEKQRTAGEVDPEKNVLVFTDGAASGNPGPAGIGVVLRYKDHLKTASKFIGIATNNEAELQAVKEGLSMVTRRDLPVRVCTDSEYVRGLLAENWKAKANAVLVYEIRQMLKKFSDIQIVRVPGHSDVEENELADSLAQEALKKANPAPPKKDEPQPEEEGAF